LIFPDGATDQFAEIADGLRLHDGKRTEIVNAARILVHVGHGIAGGSKQERSLRSA
jgi:hypothetical protein